MATVSEIPLSPVGQNFQIDLGPTSYGLAITYNESAGCWFMDIADETGVTLVTAIPLVTGCDLLDQYRYLGFVGSLEVQTDHDPDAIPTASNLGVEGRLYYISA